MNISPREVAIDITVDIRFAEGRRFWDLVYSLIKQIGQLMRCLGDYPNNAPELYFICRESSLLLCIDLLKELKYEVSDAPVLQMVTFDRFSAEYTYLSAMELNIFLHYFTKRYKTTCAYNEQYNTLGICQKCLPEGCNLRGEFMLDYHQLRRKILMFYSYIRSVI